MQNNIVVMSDIAAIMSKKSGFSEEICSLYVKELFLFAEDTLNEVGAFKIEGIGNFSNINGCIQFTPDELLTEELNSAFECFEPVELDEDVTDEILKESDIDDSHKSELTECIPDNTSVSKNSNLNACKVHVLPPPIPEEDKKVSDIKVPLELHSATTECVDEGSGSVGVTDAAQNSNLIETDLEASTVETCDSRKLHFSILSFVLGIVFGVAVCVGVNFLLSDSSWGNDVNESKPVTMQKASSHKTAIENGNVEKKLTTDSEALNIDKRRLSSDESTISNPQYYKVTESSYLSNISRRYYGHYAFWIYIYIENKDKIKDPDNLPVGIVLTIPSKEKYGIDKDDKKSIERAELKAIELFGDE